MMLNRKLNIFCFCVRNSYKHYCTFREARFIDKLINKGKLRGKLDVPRPTDKSSYAVNTLYSEVKRRNCVLNKICMDYVSDLSSYGTYAEKLHEYGISITQCKLTKNLHVLFVYWIHTKKIDEMEVNEFLINFATHLKSMLISFSVMNNPPNVQFVKDFGLLEEQKVSKLLETLPLWNNMTGTDKNTAENIHISSKIKSNVLPMQNDVFGLDYSKILKNIIDAKRKFNGN